MKKHCIKYKIFYTTKDGGNYQLWAYTKAEANHLVKFVKKDIGAVDAYITLA